MGPAVLVEVEASKIYGGIILSEYDLKKSEKGIGQLYPILEAKDGEVIDGFHREEADKNWKRVRLEHIDTEEKKHIARIVANHLRRNVPREEREKDINALAGIYKKQGIKALVQRIMEVTGLSYFTVRHYLSAEFVRPYPAKKLGPRKPASEVIKQMAETKYKKPEYAAELVERHREEVLASEKPKIEQELRTELVKSPTFQREVIKEISKPRIVKPTEVCESGVCELPSAIESGKPIDVIAERIKQFWIDNPQCRCKNCPHYGKCGVIR